MKEEETKKVTKKVQVEVKQEMIPEARDTTKAVKGKQVVDDLEFVQGPINLKSLSSIHNLQLVSITQAKASEDLLRSHTKDKNFLTLASNILEKLLPSFQKDTSDTPSGQLKSFINSIDTHFESFEKSAEEKVLNEFNAKRLQTLKKMIAKDRVTLGVYLKSMQDALFEGRNLYKSCLS